MQAGLRDGEYFYSSHTWKSFIVRPILWWNEDDVWEYVEQKKIPYNELYNKNIIRSYSTKKKITPEKLDQCGIDVEDFNNQTLSELTRKQANAIEKLGVSVFTPRTGCMMCPIPIKYGYLQWMRLNYPKVFDAMIYNLGYGKTLLNIIPDDVKHEIEQLTGISLTEENAHEHLQDILNAKPCTFDTF